MPKLKVKRVPRRYRALLRSVVLSVSMSGVVSLIVTLHNVGLNIEMPGVWWAAWQLSCAIAVPARFVVVPVVHRFVGVLVEPVGQPKLNQMGINSAQRRAGMMIQLSGDFADAMNHMPRK